MSSELRALWENAGGKCPVDAEIVSFDSLLKDSKSLAVGVMYPGEHTLGGIPLIKVGDVSGGRVISKPSYLISDEVNKEYVRTQLKGDELLITLVGNPGECVVVTPEMAGWNAARAIAVAKFKDPSLRTYVKAVLESYAGKHLIDSVLNTTVQKTLNLKDLKKLAIPLPSKDKVHQISDFVNSIDDRITLLRETNTTLEAIAQALFKSWFVDFDPVHAKQQGRAPEGMDAQTAALFPDSFEESELGMVPKGWRQSSLAEVTKLGTGFIQTGPFGSQLHASDYQDKGTPVVMPQDLEGRRISTTKIARVDRTHVERLQRHALQVGDVVFSRRGDVGRHAVATEREAGWLCGTGCLLVRPGSKWPAPAYISQALGLSSSVEWLKRHAVGATMPNLNTGILGDLPMLLPSHDVLEAFESMASSIEQSISSNDEKARLLSDLRDTLLPRLISGQLRLPEAQALVEEAVDA